MGIAFNFKTNVLATCQAMTSVTSAAALDTISKFNPFKPVPPNSRTPALEADHKQVRLYVWGKQKAHLDLVSFFKTHLKLSPASTDMLCTQLLKDLDPP